MSKRHLLAVLTLMLALGGSQAVEATTWAGPDPARAYERADVVAVATVDGVLPFRITPTLGLVQGLDLTVQFYVNVDGEAPRPAPPDRAPVATAGSGPEHLQVAVALRATGLRNDLYWLPLAALEGRTVLIFAEHRRGSLYLLRARGYDTLFLYEENPQGRLVEVTEGGESPWLRARDWGELESYLAKYPDHRTILSFPGGTHITPHGRTGLLHGSAWQAPDPALQPSQLPPDRTLPYTAVLILVLGGAMRVLRTPGA